VGKYALVGQNVSRHSVVAFILAGSRDFPHRSFVQSCGRDAQRARDNIAETFAASKIFSVLDHNLRKCRKKCMKINLSIDVFSMTYSDDKYNFFRGIDFINNSVIAVSERITTFLIVIFERFSKIRIVSKGIYASC